MLKISIPEPCHEEWQNMKATQCGAWCNVCAKEVVDFTSMTDDEVRSYFLNNNSKATCGRFKNTQLSNIDLYIPLSVLHKRIAGWKKFLAIVMLSFGSTLFGCNVHTKGKATGVVEKKSKTEKDTLQQWDGVVGDLVFPIDTADIRMSECFTPVGFTIPTITPEMIQGDIAVEDSSELISKPDSLIISKDSTVPISKDSLLPIKKIPADTTNCGDKEIYSK